MPKRYLPPADATATTSRFPSREDSPVTDALSASVAKAADVYSALAKDWRDYVVTDASPLAKGYKQLKDWEGEDTGGEFLRNLRSSAAGLAAEVLVPDPQEPLQAGLTALPVLRPLGRAANKVAADVASAGKNVRNVAAAAKNRPIPHPEVADEASLGAADGPYTRTRVLGVHHPTATKTLENTFGMLAAARQGGRITREPPRIIRVTPDIEKDYPDLAENGVEVVTINGNNGLLQSDRLNAPYLMEDYNWDAPEAKYRREGALDMAVDYMVRRGGRPRDVLGVYLPEGYWDTHTMANYEKGLPEALTSAQYEKAAELHRQAGQDFADALKAKGEGVTADNAGLFLRDFIGQGEPFHRNPSRGSWTANMTSPSGRLPSNPIAAIRKNAKAAGLTHATDISALAHAADDPTNPLLQLWARNLLDAVKSGRTHPKYWPATPDGVPVDWNAIPPAMDPVPEILNDGVLRALPQRDAVYPAHVADLYTRYFPAEK